MPFYAIYLKQKKKGQQIYGPSLQILCEFSVHTWIHHAINYFERHRKLYKYQEIQAVKML